MMKRSFWTLVGALALASCGGLSNPPCPTGYDRWWCSVDVIMGEGLCEHFISVPFCAPSVKGKSPTDRMDTWHSVSGQAMSWAAKNYPKTASEGYPWANVAWCADTGTVDGADPFAGKYTLDEVRRVPVYPASFSNVVSPNLFPPHMHLGGLGEHAGQRHGARSAGCISCGLAKCNAQACYDDYNCNCLVQCLYAGNADSACIDYCGAPDGIASTVNDCLNNQCTDQCNATACTPVDGTKPTCGSGQFGDVCTGSDDCASCSCQSTGAGGPSICN